MRENMGMFRGKQSLAGSWCEGFLVKTGDHFRISTQNDMISFGVDPATIGECTGRKDKNGKLIFEGDIVETTKYGKDSGKGANFSGPDRFIVEFFDGGYHLTNKWRRFNLRPDVDMKIIGNIHDNKELLES